MLLSDTTKHNLEATYNCHISINHIYDVIDIYSLDGCHWSTVMSVKGLRQELKEDAAALRRIAIACKPDEPDCGTEVW